MGGCNIEGESEADENGGGRGREGVREIDQSSLCALRLTVLLRNNVTEEEEDRDLF